MHHLMKKISTGTRKGMYVIFEVRPCNIFLYAYVYFNLPRVNSKHNSNVTEKIVAQVMLGKAYSSKSSIACKHTINQMKLALMYAYTNVIIIDAAKKFHEYLVRQQKPMSKEERTAAPKVNRIVQRRLRVSIYTYTKCSLNHYYVYKQLYERCLRFGSDKQERTLKNKYMTNEETGDEGFLITRSPSWRHVRLTKLLHK